MLDARRQGGFTLIELMVVVAIVAVLLSAVVVAIQPSEASKVRQQVSAVQGWMQSVCDRAAFDQHVYAMMPDEKGLALARLNNQAWQMVSATKGGERLWLDGLQVEWELPINSRWQSSDQAETPRPGWLCWPSGERQSGALHFTLGDTQRTLSWNPLGDFDVADTTRQTERNANERP